MSTYKIVRFFQDHDNKQTIDTGLTLEQAEEHCADPETSWKTCSSAEGQARTNKRGPWFDGWYKE
jgi:hypothetical protein